MKKRILGIILLTVLIMGGCTNATTQLRDAQTNEILSLQEVKRQILLRPALTPREKIAKKEDLQEVNRQIEIALQIQKEAQSTNNQITSNTISSVITGAATVGGAVWGIHELTK